MKQFIYTAMKRFLSLVTIALLIATTALSQETKVKKLEKLEKEVKTEKVTAPDSIIVKETIIVTDTLVVELGDELFSIKEIGDETKLKFGNKEIRIVENSDGVVVYKHTTDGGKEYNYNRRSHDRFKGHLGGLEIGFNGFLTDFFEISLAPEDSYFDLNTAKSYNWNAVCPAVNIGFTRHFGITTAVGISFNKYRFDGNNSIIKDDDGVVGPLYPGGDIVYTKSKLYSTYATLPIMLELQIPVAGRHTINIGAGVIGAVKLGSKTKVVYQSSSGKEKYKNKDDFSMNLLRWGTTARVGYDFFQVYGTCYFTELFEQGKGPKLYPYEIGIAFTIND